MASLFQRLFSSRRAAPARSDLPFCPGAAPDWLPEHRAQWHQFWHSPTGRVLLARGRAIHFETAARACADVFHTAHSAGAAQGFGEALAWLDSLSRSARAPAEASPADGHPDTPPTGEPELRELYSP